MREDGVMSLREYKEEQMKDEYRPEPVVAVPAAPLIWRPWMTRLGVVLGVTTPFALVIWSWLRVSSLPAPVPGWAIVSVTLAVFHLLGSSIILTGEGLTKTLTMGRALRIAWAGVYYPCYALVRLARWIATGV